MKRVFAPIILLLLAANTFAQVKNTVTKSAITFQIKNLGINTGGRLAGLQANILFDPAQLNASVIEATADANTINTDNDTRDTHLKSEEFFDVARFPKISMKSVSFKHKSSDNYTGQFNIIMKDRTKQIEVPFTYTETGNTATFKGSFKLNRTDFGVGSKSMVLSSDVTVNIELETTKS
ncbi:MAG TPA: YceI family protein [Mucilaginibacter sp.]